MPLTPPLCVRPPSRLRAVLICSTLIFLRASRHAGQERDLRARLLTFTALSATGRFGPRDDRWRWWERGRSGSSGAAGIGSGQPTLRRRD
jgi:hypothetical protein